MRSVGSFLVVVVGFPLVLAVTLAAFLPLVSWHATNDVERREWVAAWISVVTEGDVTLTGPVVARVFPRPQLVLSGARLDVERHGVRTSIAVDGATLEATLDGVDLGWTLALRQPDIKINASRPDGMPPDLETARKVFEGLDGRRSLCAWMPGRLALDGGRISVGGFGIDLEQIVVDIAAGETVLEMKGVERQSRRPLEARGRRTPADNDTLSGVIEFNLMGAEVDVAFTLRDLLGPGGVRGCWAGRLEAEAKVAADDPAAVWDAALHALTPRGSGAPSASPRARPARPELKAPRLTGGAKLDIALHHGGDRRPVRVGALQARVDSIDLLSLDEPRVDIGAIGAAPQPGPTGDGEYVAAILREVEGRLRQLVSSVQRIDTWEAPVTGIADRLDAVRSIVELTSPAELRIGRASLPGVELADATMRVGPAALAPPGLCIGGAPLQLEIGRARIGAWEAPLVFAATLDFDRAAHKLDSKFCGLGFGSGRQEAKIDGTLTLRHAGARSGLAGQAAVLNVYGVLPRIDRIAAHLREPNEGALEVSAFSHVFKLTATATTRRDNPNRPDEVFLSVPELRVDDFAVGVRLRAPRGGVASLEVKPARGQQIVDGTSLLSWFNIHPTAAALPQNPLVPMEPSGRCKRQRAALEDVILTGSIELPRLKFGDGILQGVSLDLHVGATGLALDDVHLETPGGTRLVGDIRAFTRAGAPATTLDGCLDIGLRDPKRLARWAVNAELLPKRSPVVQFLELTEAADIAGSLMLTRLSNGDIEAQLLGVEAALAGQRGAIRLSGTMHRDRADGRVRLRDGHIDLPTLDAVMAWRLFAILDGRAGAKPPPELAGRRFSITGGMLDVEFVKGEPLTVLMRAASLGLHPVGLRDVQFATLPGGRFEAKARLGQADASQFAGIYEALIATFGPSTTKGGGALHGVIDIVGQNLAVPITYFGGVAAKPADRVGVAEYTLRAELRNGGVTVDRLHGVLDFSRIRRDTPCTIRAEDQRELRTVFRTEAARGNRFTVKAAIRPEPRRQWRVELDVALTCIAPLDLRYMLTGKQGVAAGLPMMEGHVGFLRMKLGGPLGDRGFELRGLKGEGYFEALVALRGGMASYAGIFALDEIDTKGLTFRGRLGLGEGRLRSAGEPWVAIGEGATLSLNMIMDLARDCITAAANVRSHREVASKPGFDQYFQVEWTREIRWRKYELRELSSWSPFKAADNCPGPPGWPPPPSGGSRPRGFSAGIRP